MKFLCLIFIVFFSFGQFLLAQQSLNDRVEIEESKVQFFIGASTDFLSARSYGNFGFWSQRRNTGFPVHDRHKSTSSFSILPYAGIRLTKDIDLGVVFNHRSQSSRTTLMEGETGSVAVDFLSTSNLLGFGIFSSMTIYDQKRFGIFIRPALMYYSDNYQEYRDSKKDLTIMDNFIYLTIGIGAFYDFTEQLRGSARFTGFGYANGRWRQLETDIGESYSQSGRNYSRSGIYLGLEWTF